MEEFMDLKKKRIYLKSIMAQPNIDMRQKLKCISIAKKICKTLKIKKSQINFQFSLSGSFTNSSTAQKTFKLQVRKANADANECNAINLNWYNNAVHNMMAIEVQV